MSRYENNFNREKRSQPLGFATQGTEVSGSGSTLQARHLAQVVSLGKAAEGRASHSVEAWFPPSSDIKSELSALVCVCLWETFLYQGKTTTNTSAWTGELEDHVVSRTKIPHYSYKRFTSLWAELNLCRFYFLLESAAFLSMTQTALILKIICFS